MRPPSLADAAQAVKLERHKISTFPHPTCPHTPTDGRTKITRSAINRAKSIRGSRFWILLVTVHSVCKKKTDVYQSTRFRLPKAEWREARIHPKLEAETCKVSCFKLFMVLEPRQCCNWNAFKKPGTMPHHATFEESPLILHTQMLRRGGLVTVDGAIARQHLLLGAEKESFLRVDTKRLFM